MMKKGEYYRPFSQLLRLAYFDQTIAQFLKECGTQNFGLEEMKALKGKLTSIEIPPYAPGIYGETNYLRKFIDWWYEKCDGDLTKFSKILGISHIEWNQLRRIIEDKSKVDSIDFDRAVAMYENYLKNPTEESMDYLINNYVSDEMLEDGDCLNILWQFSFDARPERDNVSSSVFDFLSEMQFTPGNKREIFKYLYKADRTEAVRSVINGLYGNGTRDEDMLNYDFEGEALQIFPQESHISQGMINNAEELGETIAKELPELQDLQTIIEIAKRRKPRQEGTIITKIFEKLDKKAIATSLDEAVKSIPYYIHNRNMQEKLRGFKGSKLIEDILAGKFEEVDELFSNFPPLEALIQDGNGNPTKILFNARLEQLYRRLNEAEYFNIELMSDCWELVDASENGNTIITNNVRQRLAQSLKELLQRDTKIDEDKRNDWILHIQSLEQQIDAKGQETKVQKIAAQTIGTGVTEELLDVQGIQRMQNLIDSRMRTRTEEQVRGE